jgi:hypothetical protein
METMNISISGAITYWSVSSSTSRDMLVAGLNAAGLSKYEPALMSVQNAVKAALTDLYAQPKTLIRPDRGGFSVVDEAEGLFGLHHSTRVWVAIQNGKPVVNPPEYPDADRILQSVAYQQDLVPVVQLTAMLTSIVKSLGGLSLRESGGLYWLPKPSLSKWAEVQQILRNAGPNRVAVIQTMVDEESVAAVVEAITTEIEAEVGQMQSELASGLSDRAAKHRASQLNGLVDRLRTYESSLGITLDKLREGLVILDGGLIAAAGSSDIGAGSAIAAFGGLGDFL